MVESHRTRVRSGAASPVALDKERSSTGSFRVAVSPTLREGASDEQRSANGVPKWERARKDRHKSKWRKGMGIYRGVEIRRDPTRIPGSSPRG